MQASKTMGVSLWAGQERGRGANCATTCLPVAGRAERALDQLFIAAYPRFADACRAVDEPGLAILAVDAATGHPAGLVKLCARVGRHVTAIVGRHDQCDLFLAGHHQLALRHLAVILDPVRSWSPGATCPYRVLDLRTTDAFADESGRALRAVRCDGPAVLRCAGYALFLVPLGDPTDWPASGALAWAALPERVYLDERTTEARRLTAASAPSLPRGTRQSFITSVPGPRDHSLRLVADGDRVGTLELRGPGRTQLIEVGQHALDAGVLIGRYDRCDGRLSDDHSLSRVHALLIQLGDALCVIDTASTNGTSPPSEPRARIVEATAGRELELHLGTSTALRWRWLD